MRDITKVIIGLVTAFGVIGALWIISTENDQLSLQKATNDAMPIAQVSISKNFCNIDFDDDAASNLYAASARSFGIRLNNKTALEFQKSLSAAAEKEALKVGNLGSKPDANTMAIWCAKMRTEAVLLHVDHQQLLKEARAAKALADKNAEEARIQAEIDEKVRSEKEVKDKKEAAIQAELDAKNEAIAEVKAEKEAKDDAFQAKIGAAKALREGLADGTIIILKPRDLAVQTHKWDGKQIITNISCFYADVMDFRCVSDQVRIDFQSFEPEEDQANFKKNCDTIKKSQSKRCKLRILFSYDKYSEMDTGGFSRRLTVVVPEQGSGTILGR